MPKINFQRTKKGRLEQVARWLKEEYPTPHPVLIKFGTRDHRAKDTDGGGCQRVGREIIIDIDTSQLWTAAVETLLHEWAHAVIWPHAHLEDYQVDHGIEFSLKFGEIYRRFNDEDGCEESQLL